MIFTATRFENNALIRCEADNVVMRNEMDKPLHDTLPLEVMCKLCQFIRAFDFYEIFSLITSLIEIFLLENYMIKFMSFTDELHTLQIILIMFL